MKFTNYAAGMVKTIPYIGAGVGAVRALLAGVLSKQLIALSVTAKPCQFAMV